MLLLSIFKLDMQRDHWNFTSEVFLNQLGKLQFQSFLVGLNTEKLFSVFLLWLLITKIQIEEEAMFVAEDISMNATAATMCYLN